MKPHKLLPPEFEPLTPEQLEQVNDLLRENTYKKAQEELWAQLGIQISINKLFRYYKRLQMADDLTTSEEAAVHAQDLIDLFNGRDVPWDAAGIQTIKKRALELAADPKTKPSLLKDLFLIFTYEDRKQLNQRRVTLAERKQKFAEDRHTRAEEKNRRATREQHERVIQGLLSGQLPLIPERKNNTNSTKFTFPPNDPYAPKPLDPVNEVSCALEQSGGFR